ncbi:outer membrane beta-barrel protein [Maribellus maritimus]|uniref:outer membrane beta-barrel protein n=1 Tax=Maribellus maritimus TaxID=2870838 RepID=UPI001EEBE821|nr:outer membrane beta-barrel protein [Maribellus maritimus]MCG6188040.1 PorT family protein [Maribellus maritimus]
MRKLLIVLFISIASFTKAQEQFIGIQTGINFTNINSDGLGDMENRTGFTGGISYEYQHSSNFQFGVDVLYSQQGFASELDLVNETGNYTGDHDLKYKFDYFNLPIKIGYAFGRSIKIVPRIGIEPAYLNKCEFEVPALNMNGKITGSEIYELTDKATRFNLAGLTELGIEAKLSNRIVLCPAVSFKQSFTSADNTDFFEGSSLKHHGLSITIGVKYEL